MEHPEENPCENGESVQIPHRKGQHSNYVQLWIDPCGSQSTIGSSYANAQEGSSMIKTCKMFQQPLDSSAHYIWLPALHFETLQICFVLTEGRRWWEVWTDSLTLALWLWLCSGEPREWPEAAPTKCSPHVKDSPGICLNLYFNQISMNITPFYRLFCECLVCVHVSAYVFMCVSWRIWEQSVRWKRALCSTIIAIYIQLPNPCSSMQEFYCSWPLF